MKIYVLYMYKFQRLRETFMRYIYGYYQDIASFHSAKCHANYKFDHSCAAFIREYKKACLEYIYIYI